MFRGLRGGIPAAWSGWFVSPPRTTVAELKPSEEGNATPDSTAPEDRQASSSKGKRGIPQRRRRGCDAGRGNVPAAALSMRTIRKTILGWIDRAVGIDGGDRQASAGRNTNGTVSTTTVKSRSGYANGGRIALRCLLVTCVYALCLALKNAHLLYITLHAGTQISGLPSRSTLSVLMGRDVITAALLGVCLRQLGRRNSVPRRICMAVMGLAAVGEPFTNAVMSISSSWAAEDRMDHTAVVDESGPAFASTRMVRYITIVGRSFLDTVLRQRSWAPVTGVIHGGTAYLSSPALTLSSVPTLIILYVLLKQADEAEDAPPRVTEIASTVSISENVEDKPAEKPISNGSLTDLNITSAASVTKALGETTPRASRTSLWATVATAQEHNAWREGTEYFARELMSSALAAKCAIDHVHVHPVMHEYYMHFVTFISAVDTAIDNVEHLAWQLEHYDSTDNLMKRDGGSMVKRLLTKVLFDPSDVNERVGDAVANLADEKGIELTIHNTVQRGTLPELFLVVGDEDFLRQLLLQILYPIIANAAEYTLVDVTLDMPPPWAVKDDAKQTDSKMPRKYHVDLTWQFTYQVSDESGTPMPLIYNDYVRNLLHELGGQIRGPFPVPNAGVNTQSVELSFKMESVRYRKDIAKSMGLRLSKPMAYRQVEELFHFAETLKDFRVTVLAPCRSTFTGNVVQYLESWGMDLTYVATEDMDVIPTILTQLDESNPNHARDSHLQFLRSLIIINDDFGMLDVVINHRIASSIFGTLVIYFTSPTNHARMNEYVETIAEGHGELMPEVYIVAKPAGPRKLLHTLKWIMADRPDEAEDEMRYKKRGGALVLETSRRAVAQMRPKGRGRVTINEDPAAPTTIMSPAARSTTPLKRALMGQRFQVPSRASEYHAQRQGTGTSVSTESTTSSNESEVVTGLKDKQLPLSSKNPTTRPPVLSAKSDSLARPEPARPPPPPSTPSSVAALLFSRIKVLIAEDNPINQTILATFLRKRGISATVAANGQEALLKYQQAVYHIILMDIVMPVMDGIEATSEIRKIERDRAGMMNAHAIHTPDVVIVALTASSLPADRDAALKAGCNDYLIKPVSLVWLERKILEWGAMQALIDYDTLLSTSTTYKPGTHLRLSHTSSNPSSTDTSGSTSTNSNNSTSSGSTISPTKPTTHVKKKKPTNAQNATKHHVTKSNPSFASSSDSSGPSQALTEPVPAKPWMMSEDEMGGHAQGHKRAVASAPGLLELSDDVGANGVRDVEGVRKLLGGAETVMSPEFEGRK